MNKSVIDLKPDDLDNLASAAWKSAAQQAMAEGRPITGSRDGRRFRYYPDGRVVDLGPIEEQRDAEIAAHVNKQSVA